MFHFRGWQEPNGTRPEHGMFVKLVRDKLEKYIGINLLPAHISQIEKEVKECVRELEDKYNVLIYPDNNHTNPLSGVKLHYRQNVDGYVDKASVQAEYIY